jgi:hypothetical protein
MRSKCTARENRIGDRHGRQRHEVATRSTARRMTCTRIEQPQGSRDSADTN